jgi:hypothetical protein
MRARLLALLAAATTPLGCLSGAIYTHVTVPLDVNLDRTPVHDDYARDEAWNTLQYYVRIDWGSDGIGDIAKEHGFTRVHYADLETLSVLGIWTQRWARVYGERSAP